MIAIDSSEIVALTGGRGDVEAAVEGVTIDSRRVEPGDLFVALRGTRTDGVAHVDEALKKGAVAALVPRGASGRGRIEVDDVLHALAVVAREVRFRSRARVVGITGSTGKTSTKDILTSLLEPHVNVVASRQNENNELGVPLTLVRIERETEVAVVEMAMRGMGEIAHLAAIAAPEIGVITGVGPVHLELLGSVGRVAAAKAELLAALPADGFAIVPHGEALLAPHLATLRCPVITFGSDPAADVRLVSFRRESAGGEAEIAVRGRTMSLPVSFTSQHNAVNLTAAVAVYDVLGLPLDGVAEGARSIAFSRWRGEEIALPGGGLLIADCYNANPTSMRAALVHLRDAADQRRRVAVLGDMAELGAGAEGYHRQIGDLASELGTELVIGIGSLARGYDGLWFATVEEALEALPDLLLPQDAVLVKGSRSMGLEAVVEAIAP
jgi:UDP-N-acetylmuramoyl-tripeptide--D-alanyl-D-alanine ligase